jgi:L-fuculose-phosphate aldolase
MPDLATLREEMLHVGRLLYERGLVVATEGNLSLRLGDDHFLVTPSGACKGFLTAADLLVVDLTGQGVEMPVPGLPVPDSPRPDGGALRPSSEWRLHRQIYSLRPDVLAICHAHPPWATAFAAAGQSLDGCLLPEIIATLGLVPLAPYATPGTEEVPASVNELVPSHDALLLANHGVVTLDVSLTAAFYKLESVERLAQITLLARLAGGERRLTQAEAEAVRALVAQAGQREPPATCVPAGEKNNLGTEFTSALPGADQPSPILMDVLAERMAREILVEIRRMS